MSNLSLCNHDTNNHNARAGQSIIQHPKLCIISVSLSVQAHTHTHIYIYIYIYMYIYIFIYILIYMYIYLWSLLSDLYPWIALNSSIYLKFRCPTCSCLNMTPTSTMPEQNNLFTNIPNSALFLLSHFQFMHVSWSVKFKHISWFVHHFQFKLVSEVHCLTCIHESLSIEQYIQHPKLHYFCWVTFYFSIYPGLWMCFKHDTTSTHCGWVTHICISKLASTGWDNGFSPGLRQAII